MSLLRRRTDSHHRVTFVELFFDLVFVFAVTELSHGLLGHLALAGAVETTLLFMAVWWVWIYTSWVTNWLDPERTPVRLMLFALMLAGLVLSTSIHKAFETRGLAFAGAYVAMQVGRSLSTMAALRRESRPNFLNFARITAWLGMSGVVWIAGGLAEGEARFALWACAVAIEYCGPSVGFRFPGLGRSTTADWDVEGGHLAERCGLFIIIALGESILVTGSTFSQLEWSTGTVAAFVTCFVGSLAMWWIYFNVGSERASRVIATSADPGRLARIAYTYMHLPIVAGIVVGAVADELVVSHPLGRTEPQTAAVAIAAPALYIAGTLLFTRTMSGRAPLSHIVGLALLLALVPFAASLTPLALTVATTAILVLVGLWEAISLGRLKGADSEAGA
jgi:low temperature requirement protein LtrA